MELKQPKPIHLKCPKCGYDFSYNLNHVEEEIDSLKMEIASIMSQMKQFKAYDQHANSAPKYRRMKSILAERQAQLVQYKKSRKASQIEINIQINAIFRGLVREKLGEEVTNTLLREAKEAMQYYVYDNAKQNFTRFEGA